VPDTSSFILIEVPGTEKKNENHQLIINQKSSIIIIGSSTSNFPTIPNLA